MAGGGSGGPPPPPPPPPVDAAGRRRAYSSSEAPPSSAATSNPSAAAAAGLRIRSSTTTVTAGDRIPRTNSRPNFNFDPDDLERDAVPTSVPSASGGEGGSRRGSHGTAGVSASTRTTTTTAAAATTTAAATAAAAAAGATTAASNWSTASTVSSDDDTGGGFFAGEGQKLVPERERERERAKKERKRKTSFSRPRFFSLHPSLKKRENPADHGGGLHGLHSVASVVDALSWAPDKGRGREHAERERALRPSLVEGGARAGESRVAFAGGWRLQLHAWVRDFFISALNTSLWALLVGVAVVYLLIFFVFAGIWWLLWSTNPRCLSKSDDSGFSFGTAFIFAVATTQTVGYGNTAPNDGCPPG